MSSKRKRRNANSHSNAVTKKEAEDDLPLTAMAAAMSNLDIDKIFTNKDAFSEDEKKGVGSTVVSEEKAVKRRRTKTWMGRHDRPSGVVSGPTMMEIAFNRAQEKGVVQESPKIILEETKDTIRLLDEAGYSVDSVGIIDAKDKPNSDERPSLKLNVKDKLKKDAESKSGIAVLAKINRHEKRKQPKKNRIKINTKSSALDISRSTITDVNRGGKENLTKRKKKLPSVSLNDLDTIPLPIVSKASVVTLNLDSGTDEGCYQPPRNSGVDLQFATEFDRELDLVIGLDFGTSCLKTIVREPDRKRAWAVPFTNSSTMPYLLPTEVYLDNGQYVLQPKGKKHTGLKMPLIESSLSGGHLPHVVAYLALVIRHIRGWMFENHASLLHGAELFWKIQLGLPAANYEDEKKVAIFEQLLLTAANLSVSSEKGITEKLVKQCIVKIQRELSAFKQSGDNNWPEDKCPVNPLYDIDLYPELAAQAHGYVSSGHWDSDKPMFFLVDIGGGTVDASIFNVTTSKDGKFSYHFLRSVVEPLGSVRLHNERLNWLQHCIAKRGLESGHLESQISEIAANLSAMSIIPSSVQDYAGNVSWGDKTIDDAFYSAYGTQLFSDVLQTTRQFHTNYYDINWKKLNYLLCGGGSKNALYQKFLELMKKGGHSYKLHEIKQKKPGDLIAPLLTDENYHRLTVAYGLSYRDLGQVVTPNNVEDLYLQSSRLTQSTYRDNMVSKDDV